MGRKDRLQRGNWRCEAAEGGVLAPERTSGREKTSSDETIDNFLKRDYKYGFVSNIESVAIPKGLSEETVRIISAKKKEPEWMLEFRLNAYRQWLKMTEPKWSDNKYPAIDFQVLVLVLVLVLLCLCLWLAVDQGVYGGGFDEVNAGGKTRVSQCCPSTSYTSDWGWAGGGGGGGGDSAAGGGIQDVVYYSEPKMKEKKASLDEVDADLLDAFEKLGISLSEQKRLANVAVDAVFDSVSIATTFRKDLAKAGVIFCSISEAVREYPELIKKYLGKVVPVGDNYYAALNAAVFSDGSFCYIPKDVTCPMELSTYFRINAMETGQFERTLIVAEDNSYVSYLEVKDPSARVEHEASTSKIGEDQLFYFQQRGIDSEKAVGMIISGFCRDVFNELPLEFASEVNQLMSLKLEGSVG
eukprot:jgi/Mesen1/10608/ME000086S10145